MLRAREKLAPSKSQLETDVSVLKDTLAKRDISLEAVAQRLAKVESEKSAIVAENKQLLARVDQLQKQLEYAETMAAATQLSIETQEMMHQDASEDRQKAHQAELTKLASECDAAARLNDQLSRRIKFQNGLIRKFHINTAEGIADINQRLASIEAKIGPISNFAEQVCSDTESELDEAEPLLRQQPSAFNGVGNPVLNHLSSSDGPISMDEYQAALRQQTVPPSSLESTRASSSPPVNTAFGFMEIKHQAKASLQSTSVGFSPITVPLSPAEDGKRDAMKSPQPSGFRHVGTMTMGLKAPTLALPHEAPKRSESAPPTTIGNKERRGCEMQSFRKFLEHCHFKPIALAEDKAEEFVMVGENQKAQTAQTAKVGPNQKVPTARSFSR